MHNTPELIVQLSKIVAKNQKATIVAKSDIHERLTKKSRVTKNPLPSWAVGLTSLTRSRVTLNIDYEDTINNHLAKTGFNPCFKADPSTVSQPIKDFPNGILREGASSDRLYVRVFIDYNDQGMDLIYLNGAGVDVTSQVTQQFKEEYFPIKYGSEKQARHGVSKEVCVREYKVENIVYLECGRKALFNDLTKVEMDLLDLVELD